MAYSVHISQFLDNQVQCLLVVPHATQQEDHFGNQLLLFTDVVGFCEVIVVAGTEEVDETPWFEVSVQLNL